MRVTLTTGSTGCCFPGWELSGPRQLLPQELIDQVGDGSPLPERHPIQNLANVELQPHELNVHVLPPVSHPAQVGAFAPR